MATVITRG